MKCRFDAALRPLGRFLHREGGSIVIMALMLVVVMMMMGGLAVDLMRYENTRVKLQNSLDRATLAAASLGQQLDREAVVRDYVEKASPYQRLESVSVTQTMNATAVEAIGRMETTPIFMHLFGQTQFDAVGRSAAEQAITNLEIVLVLDVSGSMSGTKLSNLKIAAKAFVDTIMDNDPEKRATIAIVPYNAQVNLGADLVSKFNVIHPNNVANTNCVEIPTAAFMTLPVSQTDELPMMAYADIASSTNRTTTSVSPTDTSNARPSYGSAFCKPTTVNEVRLPGNDRDTLKAQIDALVAGGNTSITLGMKWGATLIDPSMTTAYADFIADGKMPAEAEARPFAYDDPETMKIIVLMTDGEHVSHDRVIDDYKTGPSPIWKGSDGNYSVQFVSGRPAAAGTNEYWVPHLCITTDCTSGVNTAEAWRATPWTVSGDAVQQDWRDIWASLRMTYVAWHFYARALGTSSTTRSNIYSATLTDMRSTWASVAQMDTTLDQTCDLVKAEGVVVYGVAVEAPTNGQAVIASCATSNAHYFEASATTMINAFQTIASNVTMLKLTQ